MTATKTTGVVEQITEKGIDQALAAIGRKIATQRGYIDEATAVIEKLLAERAISRG